MTTARRQLILTLAVAIAGAGVMLASARTPNPAFQCLHRPRAYGWPFPWETFYSYDSQAKAQHPVEYRLYNYTILIGASFLAGLCMRGKRVARPTLSIIAMLTIAPLLAVAILLLCCAPKYRSELLYPIAVATYVFRGMACNWVTYLPALIIVPALMSWISTRSAFHQLSLHRLFALSVLAGTVGGMCVVIRSVLLAALDGGGAGLVFAVVFAGAASGAVTLTLICLLYRRLDSHAELGASPNGGPAMPLGNSGVVEGPPSVS